MATASHLPSPADTEDDFKQLMTIGPKGEATRSNRDIGIFFCPVSLFFFLNFLKIFMFEQSRLHFVHLRRREAEGDWSSKTADV